MAEKDPADRVNLAGTLPVDQHNGLKPLIADLIANPEVRRFAVVEFSALYDKVNIEDGTHQVIVRFTRIEPVSEIGDVKTVMSLLDATQEARTGHHRLPLNDGEGEGNWTA